MTVDSVEVDMARRYDESGGRAKPGYCAAMGPDDLLPEQTKDDIDSGEDRDNGHDQWLRDQVPPHHGE